MTTTLATICQAVLATPASEQRKQLRACVNDVAQHNFDGNHCYQAAKDSPLCGLEADQINLNATLYPRVRDSLPWQVLAGLAFGGVALSEEESNALTKAYSKPVSTHQMCAVSINWDQVYEAIKAPATNGVENDKSKTGYSFGEPVCLASKAYMIAVANLVLKGLSVTPAVPTSPSAPEITTATNTKKRAAMNTNDIDPKTLATANTMEAGHATYIHDAMVREIMIKDDLITVEEASGMALDAMTKIGVTDRVVDLTRKLVDARVSGGDEVDYEFRVLADGGLKDVFMVGLDAVFGKDEAEAPVVVSAVPEIKDEHKNVLNTMLQSLGYEMDIGTLAAAINTVEQERDELKTSVTDLMDRLANSTSKAAIAPVSGGKLPALVSATMVKAHDVIKIKGKLVTGKAKMYLDFDVPVFAWDGTHPFVPSLDLDYVPDIKVLANVLHSLVDGGVPWLTGHTGSGKTTLIEWIGASLNWPFFRINFDDGITRLDLLGRETLKSVEVNGTPVTVSEFINGVVPQAMEMGAILCCDEVSFIHPNTAYVFQRVLEGNGLVINEDGGRHIAPAGWFRMAATDNTNGTGDETGFYQGAKVQSIAFMDRFSEVVKIEYMKPGAEEGVLKKRVPHGDKDFIKGVADLAAEVRKGFERGEIGTTISPRGTQAMVKKHAAFLKMTGDAKFAKDNALEVVLLNKCNSQDRQAVNELAKRVWSRVK